ncbi:ribosomal protein S18-alanine N-acetyltransferase [Saccharospirillum salsuginis]|uniref:[Ribosomal protein bS18]-alanine N-acetyltransferase n=1 Tax=Saccharospirillum salsuginis TaxID=418750 RepID=A0A918ND33_9GAMM|nr:ribosomal protein S18-alanine N-acetyltransferase [Saccharospirillum salsuginis]GGX58668.1 ribosomal-protein-alanine acetyltransferase [Saccharospirillum salsuginis]
MRRLVRASVPDRDRLAAIDRSAGPHSWPETALSRALERQQVLTIEIDDDIVGFLVENRVLDETTLLHLAVGAEHQGRGHAGWALKAWLADLARSGQCRCLLEVRAGNQVAVRLYERLGFEDIGRRKGYYSSPEGAEDARVMAKRLTDIP